MTIKEFANEVTAEFAESKGASAGNNGNTQRAADSDGFMNIPDDIGEELPFN